MRSCDVQRQKKMNIPVQEEREIVLPLPFCSTRALNGLTRPTHTGEGGFFTQSTDSVVWSFLETPSQTYPEVMFCNLHRHTLVQSTCKVYHHTHIIYQHSQTFSCTTAFGPPNNSGNSLNWSYYHHAQFIKEKCQSRKSK